MFSSRSHYTETTFSKHRAIRAASKSKRSFQEHGTGTRRPRNKRPAGSPPTGRYVFLHFCHHKNYTNTKKNVTNSTLTSPVITISVGPEQRLFAAHEDILSISPLFASVCREQTLSSASKRVNLVDEIPEVFSSVLEYLYKGDYYPRLRHNKRRNIWDLEDSGYAAASPSDSTLYHRGLQQSLLKDTLVYCSAERFGLEELKRLALKKQTLRSGVQCSTVLASARFAYVNTPDTDSKLRAHYLALIIRSRSTFKSSGTMQAEMEAGGKLCVVFILLQKGKEYLEADSCPTTIGSSISLLLCAITWTIFSQNVLARGIHVLVRPPAS